MPVLGGSRARITAGLLLLAWMLTITQSSAATIVWSGAGGYDLWSNPANWTGGALPASADDVVIDVTVRMDVPFAAVRRLQCEESFRIEDRGSKCGKERRSSMAPSAWPLISG